MARFFERLDELAGIDTNGAARLLDRISFVFLVVMVAAAPHSIAATQIAMGISMAALLGRLIAGPRPSLKLGLIDFGIAAFIVWSVISSLASYEPLVSLDKLRNVALFLIYYLVRWNVRSRQAGIVLALTLVFSSMVNVVWTPVERLIGRGVEIHGLDPNGPLARALLWEGDTLLSANGRRIASPDDLVAALDGSEKVSVAFYRPDFEFAVDVRSADLLAGDDAMSRLGIARWERSHNWRSRGFFRHYVTYAEVLQLIASLVLGLTVAGITRRGSGADGSRFLRAATSTPVMIACLAGVCLSLLLTVTRAPQLGFMVSGALIVLLASSRKFALAAIIIAVPLIFGALLFLQQSRQVGFLDAQDDSTRYRMTMWRDGMRLWTASPRNFIFGVGMDSVKERWREWNMYDGGRMAVLHFHSTPIQLLVERGLPGLLTWLAVLVGWFAALVAGVRRLGSGGRTSFGIVLGGLGGLAGFVVSGLVHWNLGDAVASMNLFLVVGIAIGIVRADGPVTQI
ncbi:MAG: O-antigen ligase family protein [Acidobacteria bacterium]|nr:O-antigen ligase family protein [Acidobacteriota bacterium]MCW5948298.1 O-antigen ligase family protein [Pyrinomonadaceae bacterium]